MKIEIIFICCILIVATASKPADGGPKTNRVVNQPHSKSQHFDPEGEHNSDFDHEEFLGNEESKKFDNLSPEESKEKLMKIVKEKIDKDKDGFVSNDELKDWIQNVSKRYLVEDAKKQWKEYETSNGLLTWEEYVKKSLSDSDDSQQEQDVKKTRDERRFKKADHDNDGKLTYDEFIDFLHPEEVPRMKDVVIDETMDDIDKNKDGFVDINEYINDMWSPSEGESEPEWLATEREQFSSTRDKNKDGKLDRKEVQEWIMPDDFGHIEAEANHLVQQADADKDGKLSHQEILDKYDVFVGSQATDFGEELTRHEEL